MLAFRRQSQIQPERFEPPADPVPESLPPEWHARFVAAVKERHAIASGSAVAPLTELPRCPAGAEAGHWVTLALKSLAALGTDTEYRSAVRRGLDETIRRVRRQFDEAEETVKDIERQLALASDRGTRPAGILRTADLPLECIRKEIDLASGISSPSFGPVRVLLSKLPSDNPAWEVLRGIPTAELPYNAFCPDGSARAENLVIAVLQHGRPLPPFIDAATIAELTARYATPPGGPRRRKEAFAL